MLGAIEKYISFFRFDLHGAYMRKRLPPLAEGIRGKLLDVGAGDQPYRDIFPVETYIATNTRRHYKANSEIEKFTDLWIDDASELPLPDADVDSVVCFQVLSVVQSPEKFFTEAHRVLKPGGKLLLTTDLLYPSWSEEDKARYSAGELKRMAGAAGFAVKEIQGFGGIRSLQYMLHMRWVMGYYERVRKVKGMRKTARALQWAIWLAQLPLLYVKGWWAFLLEKNVSDNLAETFNLLLSAEKPAEK